MRWFLLLLFHGDKRAVITYGAAMAIGAALIYISYGWS